MSADLACGHDEFTGNPECVKTTWPNGLQDEVIPTVCFSLCNTEHHLMLAATEGELVPGSQAEIKYNMIKQDLYDEARRWCLEIASDRNIVFIYGNEINCTQATQDEVPFHAGTFERCYSNPDNAPCPFDDIPGSVCVPPALTDTDGMSEICEPDAPNTTGAAPAPGLYGVSSWSQVISCNGSSCNVDIDFAEMLNENPELAYYDSIGATFLQAPNGQIGLKLTSVGTTSLAYALGLRRNDFIMSVLGVPLNSLNGAENLRTALAALHHDDDLASVPVKIYRGTILSTRNYTLVDMPNYP